MNASPSPTAILQTDYATFELREKEQLIYITFFATQVLHFEIERMKKNYVLVKQMSADKRLPVLYDLRLVEQMDISDEAKQFTATNPESTEARSADAILINSYFNRLFVNIYLSFNKPSLPTKLFSNEVDALNWIRGLKKAIQVSTFPPQIINRNT